MCKWTGGPRSVIIDLFVFMGASIDSFIVGVGLSDGICLHNCVCVCVYCGRNSETRKPSSQYEKYGDRWCDGFLIHFIECLYAENVEVKIAHTGEL